MLIRPLTNGKTGLIADAKAEIGSLLALDVPIDRA
jgi:hypothetical protein